MKKLLLLVIFLITFLLSWCWKEKNFIVSFSDYQFSLPWTEKNWLTTSSAIIENKQIKEKILKIIKPKDKNQKLNIIISTTTIKWNINFNDFITANIENVKKNLFWYQPISLKSKTIECKNKKIKIWIHQFKIDQSILNQKDKTYYVSQIYIFQSKNWYIIQISSLEKNLLYKYTNQIVNTLKCSK